jgi:hypothetical protein
MLLGLEINRGTHGSRGRRHGETLVKVVPL